MTLCSRLFHAAMCAAFALPGGFATAANLADVVPPGGFRVPGQADLDMLATGLDHIGDFNNDGFDDVAIGVPFADRAARNNDAGEVVIVFGSGTSPTLRDLDPDDLDGTNGLKILGPIQGNGGGFGSRIAGVGDLNFDGIDDLIVSNHGNGSDVWVIYGSASYGASINLDSPPAGYGYRITDGTGSSGFGSSLSALDLNADDRLDIVIGDTDAGSNAQGLVYVLFGQPVAPSGVVDVSALSPTSSPRLVKFEGEAANSSFGTAHTAMFYNSDNTEDLVVGAPDIDIGSGRFYVVFGRQDVSPGVLAFAAVENLAGFSAAQGVAYATNPLPELAGSQFGSAFAVADFNANGVVDIAIGAPLASAPGRSEAGQVVVLYGAGANPSTFRQTVASHLNNIGGVVFQGSANYDQFGAALSAPGDTTGDGTPDLLMASPFADHGEEIDAGRIYLVPGRRPSRPFPAVVDLSNAPANLAITTLDGEAGSHAAGGALPRKSGDINGDGAADLLIGAPNADLPSAFIGGAAYLIFGQRPARIFCNGFEQSDCTSDP